ncbi:K+-transporting ATPase, KdpF subunit [Beggiatoa alba B18LD]|uniref:K+-transporting ATPase, KdpF subunit n=1 Tax=Beggiatoa alba B18LD TaxID=395493 RepID=I3CE81_9GAMM|nr:K(+)-transporting ATPase subunit F [Beggiatoa alba]EIJ41924.1 K+-transporting ATPase, KdpF subunit [Beggiatoa alba B18LD]
MSGLYLLSAVCAIGLGIYLLIALFNAEDF